MLMPSLFRLIWAMLLEWLHWLSTVLLFLLRCIWHCRPLLVLCAVTAGFYLGHWRGGVDKERQVASKMRQVERVVEQILTERSHKMIERMAAGME